MGTRIVNKRGNSEEIQTKAKIAKRGTRKIISRFLLVGNVLTVVGIIQTLRDWFNEDIPTVARETLRAMGLDYGDDDELSVAGFTSVVARQTGVPFTDLSDAEATKRDLASFAFEGMYQATGFRPTSLDPNQFKQQLTDFVLAQIESPTNAIPGVDFVNQIKKVAKDAKRMESTTIAPLGWQTHLRLWNQREAQRSYGNTHKQVWSFANLVYRDHWTPHVRVVAKEETIKKAYSHNKRHVWMPMAKGDEPTAELIEFSDGSHYFMTWDEALRRHYRGYYDFPQASE